MKEEHKIIIEISDGSLTRTWFDKLLMWLMKKKIDMWFSQGYWKARNEIAHKILPAMKTPYKVIKKAHVEGRCEKERQGQCACDFHINSIIHGNGMIEQIIRKITPY